MFAAFEVSVSKIGNGGDGNEAYMAFGRRSCDRDGGCNGNVLGTTGSRTNGTARPAQL
jgi:hypothetical protein